MCISTELFHKSTMLGLQNGPLTGWALIAYPLDSTYPNAQIAHPELPVKQWPVRSNREKQY